MYPGINEIRENLGEKEFVKVLIASLDEEFTSDIIEDALSLLEDKVRNENPNFSNMLPVQIGLKIKEKLIIK